MIGPGNEGGTRAEYLAEARRELQLARLMQECVRSDARYAAMYLLTFRHCIESAREFRRLARAAKGAVQL